MGEVGGENSQRLHQQIFATEFYYCACWNAGMFADWFCSIKTNPPERNEVK